MNMTSASELYSKDTKVWVHSRDSVWQVGVVTRPLANQVLLVEVDDGRATVTLQIKGDLDLPPLCNPDILTGVNDLTHLSFLHEPGVLYNLKVRFLELSTIYTYCGIVLVAINPYQSLPIYGTETITAYHSNESVDMDPHVYGVMEEAFRQMKRESKNQSVIISGESGSGKTVSAKYGLRYFASVCGAVAETKIERKVLASNPIMEAIGNAKTTRNDNSSRFGKYIEIGFSNTQSILGATMRTFLLEKSRVVGQGEGERNYHVFYQLCAMRDEEQFKELELMSAEDFHYTNQGSSTDIIGVNDKNDFTQLTQSFHWLGFTTDQLQSVYRLLAAILHLGNVCVHQRKTGHEDASYVDQEEKGIGLVSKLLGLPVVDLCKWLCNKKIVTKHESLVKSFTVSRAINARDSFSKHLYAHLFNWIVQRVNQSLQSLETHHSFIGILDIYGFEVFKINSFEQFCINYANEKLQQQFNMHVFKLEQQEYVQEGIEWSFINYYDNQPCIDLIEGSLGILDLLDETCKMPGSSDDMFIQKLYNTYIKKNSSSSSSSHAALDDASQYFSKPRTSTTAFNVHHYAYVVTYEKDLFTDKNIDSLIPEHLQILQQSKEEFLVELFTNKIKGKQQKHGPLVRRGSTIGAKSTVGSQFRDSLTDLMKALNSTTPHYIRCIKPNDSKAPFEFNPHRTIEQLRACGVLETIRISAAGFPSRCLYYEFFCRYFMLLKWSQRRKNDHKSMAVYILQKCITDPKRYQLGKTKIFFRAGQVAYLERLRADKIQQSVILVQSHTKGWSQRRKYLKLYKAVEAIQKYGRGLIARRLALSIRQSRAAIKIQSMYRMYSVRKHYQRMLQSTIMIQCYYRRWRATLLANHLRLVKATVVFQKSWRGRKGRVYSRQRYKHIVMIQCRVRMWIAKRKLKALKIEARSVDHFKSLNKGLEIKIIELQQKLLTQAEVMSDLNRTVDNLTTSNDQLLDKARFHEEYQVLRDRVIVLEGEVERGRKSEECLLEQLNELKCQMEHNKEAHRQETEAYSEHIIFLKNQLQEERAAHDSAIEEASSHTGLDWDRLKQDHAYLQQHHQNVLLHNSELEEQLTVVARELDSTKHSLSEVSVMKSGLIHDNLSGSLPDLSSSAPLLSSSPLSKDSPLRSLLPLEDTPMDTPLPLEDTPTTNSTVDVLYHQEPGGDQLKGDNLNDVQRLQIKLDEMTKCLDEANREHDQETTRMKSDNEQLQNELNAYRQLSHNLSIIDLNKSLQGELNKLLEENTALKERLSTVGGSSQVSQKVALVALSPCKTQGSFFDDDGSSAAVIYRSVQEKPCLGMLSWQPSDLPLILKSVILESHPIAGTSEFPYKEAHLLFMCLRYADHCNSEGMTSQLMEGVLSSINTILQVHKHNMRMLSYWLGNVTCFLNSLRQYSGDPLYHPTPCGTVPLTSQTSLTSFELSDYHHVVMDQAIHLYQGVLRLMKEKIEPMIVPGLMEHNPLPGISSGLNVGGNTIRRFLGTTNTPRHKISVDNVDTCLSDLMTILRDSGVDINIMGQLLKQVFYFINGQMLNHLLLRKDMCHWSRGVQMRYNLNVLEELMRENCSWSGDVENSVSAMLQPMVQACKLLQMKKQTNSDVDEIIDLCRDLHLSQIQKLLTMYTSTDGLEQRVPSDVIKYVSRIDKPAAQLMVDLSYQFPIDFPFLCLNVDYADMKIPQRLNHLVKI